LAVYGSCAKLLNFGQVGFEELVDPAEQLSSGKIDSVIEIDGDLVDHSSC